jgi:hypothetical protein
MRLALVGPPAFEGTWGYRVTGGKRPVTGRIRPLQTVKLRTELVRDSASGHFGDLRIESPNSVLYPGNRKVGLLVTQVSRAAC